MYATTHQCIVSGCHWNKNGDCGTTRCINYTEYRKVTRVCDVCGSPVKKHPECQACGVVCGDNHVDSLLIEYRGKKLCQHCVQAWKKLELISGKQVDWRGYVSPKMSPVSVTCVTCGKTENLGTGPTAWTFSFNRREDRIEWKCLSCRKD